jgi:hypothetical protein
MRHLRQWMTLDRRVKMIILNFPSWNQVVYHKRKPSSQHETTGYVASGSNSPSLVTRQTARIKESPGNGDESKPRQTNCRVIIPCLVKLPDEIAVGDAVGSSKSAPIAANSEGKKS